MTAGPGARVFRSRHHPGEAPWGLVYARAVVQPVGVCMLPVMVASLVAALEGLPLQPYVWWGFFGAIGLAVAWTRYRLDRTLAEIRVDDGVAAVLTVRACTQRDAAPAWEPVHDVRDYGRWTFVTIGLQSYEVEAADWPAYADLRDALRAARPG